MVIQREMPLTVMYSELYLSLDKWNIPNLMVVIGIYFAVNDDGIIRHQVCGRKIKIKINTFLMSQMSNSTF